jgi:hypothetical protein
MAYKKELSKCCSKCGVEWLPDLSNKTAKRALCLECRVEVNKEYSIKNNLGRKRLYNRMEKKSPYTMKNRTGFWRKINAELKGMKKREEWLGFIQNRMQEILNDKALMDYINDTDIENKYN